MVVLLGVILIATTVVASANSPTAPLPPRSASTHRVTLAGEFEPQGALLIGCHNLVEQLPELFSELVEIASQRIAIIALVCDQQEKAMALAALAERNVPTSAVRFADVPHDSMWMRDYGPRIVGQPNGRLALLDALYADRERYDDDRLPARLGHLLRIPVVRVPLAIDGGNLLVNGSGLCVATRDLVTRNREHGFTEADVRSVLRDHYGATETVFLEPLAGEPTGHVDMFATFTSADTIVVGQYDPKLDATNAAILDRNAAVLARVRTRGGRLQVERVPMPTHSDGRWRTYTNAVFANGVLLVPVYPGMDVEERPLAWRTYSRLLGGWTVVGIDAEQLAQLGGGLHCLVMNAPPLGRLPRFPPPRRRVPFEVIYESEPANSIAARPWPRKLRFEEASM